MSTTSTLGAPTVYTSPTNNNISGEATNASSTISQSGFLSLITAQLENQDPMDPESDTDFATQMAQFESLDQLTSLNTTASTQSNVQQLQSGALLIGQNVTSSQTDSAGNPITGTVTSATVNSSGVDVTINGASVPLSSITTVN